MTVSVLKMEPCVILNHPKEPGTQTVKKKCALTQVQDHKGVLRKPDIVDRPKEAPGTPWQIDK